MRDLPDSCSAWHPSLICDLRVGPLSGRQLTPDLVCLHMQYLLLHLLLAEEQLLLVAPLPDAVVLQERRVASSLISHGQGHLFKAWPKAGGASASRRSASADALQLITTNPPPLQCAYAAVQEPRRDATCCSNLRQLCKRVHSLEHINRRRTIAGNSACHLLCAIHLHPYEVLLM